MNKIYKHKTLGWMAEMQGAEYYYIDSVNCGHFIDKRILLEGQDREEVIEKDWVDHLHNDLFYVAKDISVSELRQAIEKHAPKPVKFTRNEVAQRKHSKNIVDLQNMTITDTICMFLDNHNIFNTKTG